MTEVGVSKSVEAHQLEDMVISLGRACVATLKEFAGGYTEAAEYINDAASDIGNHLGDNDD
jgi:hypothetical protein